jgi:NAD(P)-dependent dehydrogenase (short-subunit alcohol dehydrogenase family)
MSIKNILIIGGSSGIGEAIVSQLGDRANLFLGSRSVNNKSSNVSKLEFEYDVMNNSPLPVELPEKLDGLVYCPGTIRLRPFAQLKDEEYMEDHQINFMGAVRVIREAPPGLSGPAPLEAYRSGKRYCQYGYISS